MVHSDKIADKHVDDKIEEINSKISVKLLNMQREAFEKELKALNDLKLVSGKSATVRERLVGSKSSGQEAAILLDLDTQAEVTDPVGIKSVCLDYCTKLLTNREPKPDYKEDVLMKVDLHNLQMNEEIEDDCEELSDEHFPKTYSFLTKKHNSKYEFICKGGAVLKAALSNLCQVVWKSERLPK